MLHSVMGIGGVLPRYPPRGGPIKRSNFQDEITRPWQITG